LRVRAAGITPQKVDALHASIIEEVNRDGQRWISAATVNGESVIRTMVISYLTEERHIKDLQASLVAACSSLGLESSCRDGHPRKPALSEVEGSEPSEARQRPLPAPTLSPDHIPQGRLVMDNQHRPLQFRRLASAELGEQASDGFAAGTDQL